jgi:GTP cyclohydrolase I
VSEPTGHVGVDRPRIEAAIRETLFAIGEDPDREGLRDTPARVARSYEEVFAGVHASPRDVLTTVFDLGHDEMVLVKDIEVYSTCEQHGKIAGLSKFARLVEVFARRPQVQERLTSQIADSLVEILEPRGVIVVLECVHLCMSMRGVRKPGARTVTSAMRGKMRDPATRAEALGLILGRS